MKLKTESKEIETAAGQMKLIILRPADQDAPLPGILRIHGGGYVTGMAAMVHYSCGMFLAHEFGAVVVSPEYRLATAAPYPAALDDCYAALCWMNSHADELNIDRTKIVVGGESAGGGLAAAVCGFHLDRLHTYPYSICALFRSLITVRVP